jgi:twinkle protein
MNYALRYAELGIPVFPCVRNGKIPAVSTGFKSATTDVEVIGNWASGLNVATPTGSRWWVLDIDPRHGGDEALDELEQKHGNLPPTLFAKTPSGGRHYFFRENPIAANTAGKVGKGLDTRGAGGYVLIEGSVIDGRRYEFQDWDVESEPIPNVLPAPQWLLDLAFGKPQKEPAKNGIVEGARNVYLAQQAGRMRKLGSSKEEIIAAVQALNISRCSPPLSESESRAIATSISRYPVEGKSAEPPRSRLLSAANKRAQLEDLWDKGMPGGFKTGWPSVDQLYTVVPGQLTVVTGWPNSGKSEWVDALLVNLARQGWHLAYFSPENQPIELHIAKILEKFDGRPFAHGKNERLPRDNIGVLTEKMEYQFRFLEPMEGALSAMDVCKITEEWLLSDAGPAGLVIDPWNELEHWRPANMSETEYVSSTLSDVRRWARANNIHVWIVAHPQKVKREEGVLPVPKPDMISGSQHWWNKADCAVTVFRDMNKETQDVDIYIQKCRFKHVGRIGKTTLQYDRITGIYREHSQFTAKAYRNEA